MKFKKALKILGVTLLIIVGTLAALPFVFKNKITQWVKNEVNKEFNATVDFTSARLSFFRTFPDVSIVLESFTIEGVGEFEGEKLANIPVLAISLDIMTVFRGEVIKIKSVVAEEPDLRLIVLPSGNSNWDILKSEELETEEQEEGVDYAVLKFYEIKNGSISFEHHVQGFYLTLDEVNHIGSGDFGSESFKLTTRSEAKSLSIMYDKVSYLKEASLTGAADFLIAFNPFEIAFLDNEWQLNELAITFEGSIEMPEDDIVFDLKFEPTQTDFKTLLSFIPAIYKNNFNSIQTKGVVGFHGYLKGLYRDSPASMPGFGLQLSVNQGSFKYPNLPRSVDKVQFDLSIHSEGKREYDDMVIHLKQGSMEIGGNPLSGNFTLRTPFSDPDIDLSLKGNVNLEDFADIIPTEPGEELKGLVAADVTWKGKLSDVQQKRYKEFTSSGHLTLDNFGYKTSDLPYDISAEKVRFNFTPQALQLEHAELLMGNSDVTMQGRLDNYLQYIFSNELLSGSFQARSKYFNLNELMTAIPEEDIQEAPDSLYAFALPSNVDFKIGARVDQLIYDNLDIRNVSGHFAIKEQVAYLDQIEMFMLGGKVLLAGSYDVKNINTPKVDFEFDLQKLDIKEVVSKFNTVAILAPLAERTTGSFSTGMSFKSDLNHHLRPDLTSVIGKGRLAATNLFIEGFEPLNEMAARLNITRLAKQRIEDLKLIFKIEEGRVVVDPYDLNLGDIKANIAGFTTLDQQMSYKVQLDIPRSEFGSKPNEVLNSLVRELEKLGLQNVVQDYLKVDVLLEGSIKAPRVKIQLSEDMLNTGRSITDQVKQIIDDKVKDVVQQIDDKKEEIKEAVEDKVDEAKLKAQEELNRRADQLILEAEAQAARLRAEAKRSADTVRKESEEQASKLEAEATNPLRQAGAKLAADKIRREGQRTASLIEQEAEERINKLLLDTKDQADRIRRGD